MIGDRFKLAAAFCTLSCALLAAPAGVRADDAKTESEMKPYKAAIGTWLEMVPIKGGKFTMGSPASEAGRGADEGSQFEVEVEPFWMGKYEVTWDDYQMFRDEYPDRKKSGITVPKEKMSDAVSIPTPLWEQDSAPILKGMGQYGGFPAADISQFAAKQFTKWLSKRTGHFYRLPTEAEWEYAARAGTKTAYFFGDSADKLGDYAWNFDNSVWDDPDKGMPGVGSGYRIVGKKKPNPWGLYDIYGNVAEWVIDGYTKDHYAQFAGKSVRWKDAVDWPKVIFPTTARGGHWDAGPEGCRSATRLASDKMWQHRDPQLPKSVWWYTDAFHVGFRIVRPLKEPSEEEKLKYWEPHSEDIADVLKTSNKELKALIEKK